MAAGRYTQRRRTAHQIASDEGADRLAAFLGKSLRNARKPRGMSQATASEKAGISQPCWSDLERGRGANVSLRVWMHASSAVDADLHAYLERVSGAGAPRDAVHLRHQELVARTAAHGGWQPLVERALGGAGVADLLLARADERALIEVWDWFSDVGDAFRTWDRKVERIEARGEETVAGC